MDASGNLDLDLFRVFEMLRVPRVVLVDDHLLVADHNSALCQRTGIHIGLQGPAQDILALPADSRSRGLHSPDESP